MRLNEIEFNDAQPIEGYGPGFFRIGGEVLHGPVITGPTGTQGWAGLDDLEGLLALKGLKNKHQTLLPTLFISKQTSPGRKYFVKEEQRLTKKTMARPKDREITRIRP